LLAFGQTVLRGESANFSAQEARSLFAQPHLQFEQEPLDRPGSRAKRDRWADYAESIGVPVTNAMSRAEIVAAVDAADMSAV
jgi:hypothetical protein